MGGTGRRRIGPELRRLRREARHATLFTLRVTAAAVSSYVIAAVLFTSAAEPLFAPLTAMLVVQVTPVSLLTNGIDRVLAVVAGVSLAVAFASVVPLSWWSLGLLIAVCVLIGQVLRLTNVIEVAVSGMLVLGVGALAVESAAWERIAETLIGAAAAIATNLLFPPGLDTADAGEAIDDLADSVSDLLQRAAEGLEQGAESPSGLAASSDAWLEEARTITRGIPDVGATLRDAEEGRRLNVRVVATPDVGPGLRQGLEALEHAAVAVRSLFRSVADATHEVSWVEEEPAARRLADVAATFRELAMCVDAFGQLVREDASARTPGASAATVRALGVALTELHAGRRRLQRWELAGAEPELVELHAATLSTVKRIKREMDLDERVRSQVRMQRKARRRRRTPPPAIPEPATDNGTSTAETEVFEPPARARRRQRPQE